MAHAKLSKAQLIKLFTRVPAAFVDDFYAFLKDKKRQNDFSIDLEKVSKWLKVAKYNLLKTLRGSYTQNKDYTTGEVPNVVFDVDAKVNPKGAGRRRKLVMLTPDCFKRLCMRSRSAKAETVRTYFNELDKFLDHYADQISDGITRDIEAVSKKMVKAPGKDGPGYLYVLRASADNPDLKKIGHAADLIKRLATYNTGRAEDVELLYAYRVEKRKAVEACVKGMMEGKRFRKRREIYEIDLDILKALINGCNELSMELHHAAARSRTKGKYFLMFADKDT
jgi:hypothetical protein